MENFKKILFFIIICSTSNPHLHAMESKETSAEPTEIISSSWKEAFFSEVEKRRTTNPIEKISLHNSKNKIDRLTFIRLMNELALNLKTLSIKNCLIEDVSGLLLLNKLETLELEITIEPKEMTKTVTKICETIEKLNNLKKLTLRISTKKRHITPTITNEQLFSMLDTLTELSYVKFYYSNMPRKEQALLRNWKIYQDEMKQAGRSKKRLIKQPIRPQQEPFLVLWSINKDFISVEVTDKLEEKGLWEKEEMALEYKIFCFNDIDKNTSSELRVEDPTVITKNKNRARWERIQTMLYSKVQDEQLDPAHYGFYETNNDFFYEPWNKPPSTPTAPELPYQLNEQLEEMIPPSEKEGSPSTANNIYPSLDDLNPDF